MAKFLIPVAIVESRAGLYGHGNLDYALHGVNALCNEVGFGHQADTESARLDSIARATDVEVNFVVPEVFTDPGRS